MLEERGEAERGKSSGQGWSPHGGSSLKMCLQQCEYRWKQVFPTWHLCACGLRGGA